MKMTKAITLFLIVSGLLVGSLPAAMAQAEEVEAIASPDAPAASLEPAVDDAIVLPPPEVEGIEWADISVMDGPQIEATSSEGTLAQWEALLTASEATYEQAAQLNAQALLAETGEGVGMYSAIRIIGSDEAVLRDAILGVFREGLDPDETTFEDGEIGSKAVTIITRDDDERAVVYVHIDVAHLIDLPDEQLEELVVALP